jgi:hypothetical protein
MLSNAEKEAAGLAYFGVTGRAEDQPSQITNLIYSDAAQTTIAATKNGQVLSIPAVAGNRHYDQIVEQGLEVSPYAAPAQTWADVRVERDALLVATDHYGLSDVSMSSEMIAYRQALRDVPQDNADPTNINWPSKP